MLRLGGRRSGPDREPSGRGARPRGLAARRLRRDARPDRERQLCRRHQPGSPHHVDLLAWLLPLLGLLLIGLGVGISKDRPAAGARAGVGVIAAGVVLGSAALALGIVANSLAERTDLRSVLMAAAWHELDGPIWWMSGALVACGAVTALACSRLDVRDQTGEQTRSWRSLVTPTGPWGFVGRALVLALAGVALIARPDLAASPDRGDHRPRTAAARRRRPARGAGGGCRRRPVAPAAPRRCSARAPAAGRSCSWRC